MKQENFQLNNSTINSIIDFAKSTNDLLFLTGPEGSAKSESIELVVPKLSKDYLVFRHFCFVNSVIDDFLLNFYDGFRDFSIAKKISLKKFMGDDFKEKISHYFKTVEKECIIIVENFEAIENTKEIIDFLCHLANFDNIKIIIVSKNEENNIFQFRSIKMVNIKIEQIDKDDFKNKFKEIENVDKNSIEEFYNISKGRELFLEMTLKFLSITNISLKELIEEYNTKNEKAPVDFEEFIITKFITLTPKIYLDLFRFLCLLNPCVSNKFIDYHNIGNSSYIDYLSKNFLINFFKDEIYVKDYFKKYIQDSFSAQEKLLLTKKIVDIFENELTKSPKDRLIRLSRESIRKEINDYQKQIPFLSISGQSSSIMPIQDTIKQSNLSVFGMQAIKEKNEKKEKVLDFSSKLKKIKERKKALEIKNNFNIEQKENKNELKDKILEEIIEKINSSKVLSEKYKYNEALEKLVTAQNEAKKNNIENNELIIEIICLKAKNYELLNDYTQAKNNYIGAYDLADKINSKTKGQIEFNIALCNKNLFKLDLSKEQFEKIANNENVSETKRAQAFIELGEISEAQSSENMAIEYYLKAIPYLNDDIKLSSKCYYKLALLYDEKEDVEKAIYYYQKNYMLSSDPNENKYYSISLNNIGLIYIEQSNYEQALKLLEMALEYDKKTNNYENIYFTQKELAKLYSIFDENEMENYYLEALNSAKILKDDFKLALVYFEKGEYYYDKQKDLIALENFNKAKEIIKEADSENIDRINTRIKDIKIRLNYGK